MHKQSMNHVFRVVWNVSQGCWVAVAETAKGRTKSSSAKKVLVSIALGASMTALAASDPPKASNFDEIFKNANILDGDGQAGCMLGVELALCNNVDKFATQDTIFTQFKTQGGAGSGGGAGLGGVFFIDTDEELKLENVQFSANLVQGGDGGSLPAVNVLGQKITLKEREASLSAITLLNAKPIDYIFENDVLKVTTFFIEELPVELQVGQLVKLPDSDKYVEISSVSDSGKFFSVRDTDAFSVESSVFKNLKSTEIISTVDSLDSGKITLTGADLQTWDAGGTLLEGAVVMNSLDPTSKTVVEKIDRDINGKITSLELQRKVSLDAIDGDMPSFTEYQIPEDGLNFANPLSITSSQFALANVVDGQTNTLKVSIGGSGVVKGMLLKGDGLPKEGVTITGLDHEKGTITLSQYVDVSKIGDGFDGHLALAQENSNKIIITDPKVNINIGDYVYDDGKLIGEAIGFDKENGILTLSQNLAKVPQSIQTSIVKSVSGKNITLDASSAPNLQEGQILTGKGIVDGTSIVAIKKINGLLVIELSEAPEGAVTGFTASSPLIIGGAMNGLASKGGGGKGRDGASGSESEPWRTDGEGEDGSGGAAARITQDNQHGGNGGRGGDGSDGVPFNYELTMDVTKATKNLVNATAEAAGVLATFPPDVGELGAALKGMVTAGWAMREAGIQAADWVKGMEDGSKAVGGDGGDGGSGGNGSEFLGGGAGGNGGDGGKGALERTDGGSGGAGGKGGDGGFGAGGGSGGEGGARGASGYVDNAGEAGSGGRGGFGAGQGSDGDGLGGGGGSGYGGAIFVRGNGSTGGTLTITGNALFRNNEVAGGNGGDGGQAGQAAGSDLFIMKGGVVTLSPGYGNTIRFEGSIADDSAASIDGGRYAAGSGASITLEGGGLVQFAGENTYSGKTIIKGSTLETEIGTGIHEKSTISFQGATLTKIEPHKNAGVLLLTEDVTKKAGTAYGNVEWSGSGGFAAGKADGITINLGKISSTMGQSLTWGSHYLEEDSVLVFGSEYGLGSVHWMNKIDLDKKTGNIIVFDSKQKVDGVEVNDAAYMYGDIKGGGLNVGANGYNGTLYLLGQNELSGININSGTVSTLKSTEDGEVLVGQLFSKENTIASVDIQAGAKLVLGDDEHVKNITTHADHDSQGVLTVGDKSIINISENLENSGATNLLGAINVAIALNNTGTFNQGSVMEAGELRVNHESRVTAEQVANHGLWNVHGQQFIETQHLNGEGVFQLNENKSAEDVPEIAVLNLSLASDSEFGGTFQGAGQLIKSGAGALTLDSNEHALGGGLVVSEGSLTTAGTATLGDSTDVTVLEGASFTAGTQDTWGTLRNAGTVQVNAQQAVDSMDNQVGGTVTLAADVQAQGAVVNNGQLLVQGAHSVTTTGLSGSGAVELANGAHWTLDQRADSIYTGTITGTEGVLTKTGESTLLIQRSAQTDAPAIHTNQLVINQGTVALDGAYLLAKTQNVTVARNALGDVYGTLSLIQGDQSIQTLDGGGVINTGKGNVLWIEDGGSFTGNVTGSGVLNIKGGQFNISGDLTSTDDAEQQAQFNVGSMEAGNAATSVGQNGSLSYSKVSVNNHSALEVQGRVETTQLSLVDSSKVEVSGVVNSGRIHAIGGGNTLHIASDGEVSSQNVDIGEGDKLDVQGVLSAENLHIKGELHLGDGGAPSDQDPVIAGQMNQFLDGSLLSGSGALRGVTYMGSNARLKPGNSPGRLVFDDLSLDGAIAELEIGGAQPFDRVAGTDYDQVVVGGQLNIDPASTLLLTKADAAAVEPAKGEVFHLLDVAPGKVTGHFGHADSAFDAQTVLSVSTGHLIGLGNESYAQFANRVAQNANQASMLSDFEVQGASGNISQVRGGKLTQRLLQAEAAGGSTQQIFALTSPEVYAGLVSQSMDALNEQNSLALEMGKPVNAGTAEILQRSRTSRHTGEHVPYALEASGLRIGYTGALTDGLWRMTASMENGDIKSTSVNSSTRGHVVSLAGLTALQAVPGLHVTGRISYGAFTNDVSRTTNEGKAHAHGVRSEGMLGGIGLAYITQWQGVRMQASAEITQAKSTVDGVTEKNDVSASDAFTIAKQSQTETRAIFGWHASGTVTGNLGFQVGVHVLAGGNKSTPVHAAFQTEDTRFSVRGQGLGGTVADFSAGLNYRFGTASELAIHLRKSGGKGSMTQVQLRHAF